MKISVCIVNYNGMRYIDECVRTVLQSLEGLDSEVVLVDNASTDGSGSYIAEKYPQVKVIFSKENLGYAGGSNLGFKHMTGEYGIILNNDVWVEPDWAKEMIEYMNRNPAVGVAGCTVKAPYDVWNKGTMGIVGDNIWEANTAEPFYVAGVCMAVRREVVREPFDSDYFLAAEDVYLCWLLRLRGCRIGLAPNVVIHHEASHSRSKVPALSAFYGERNKMLNFLIFYSLSTLLRISPLILLLCLMQRNFRAYLWLVRNWRLIIDKRKRIQSQRRVGDEDITKYMSSRLSHHNELLNTLSRWYLKLVRVKTLET